MVSNDLPALESSSYGMCKTIYTLRNHHFFNDILEFKYVILFNTHPLSRCTVNMCSLSLLLEIISCLLVCTHNFWSFISDFHDSMIFFFYFLLNFQYKYDIYIFMAVCPYFWIVGVFVNIRIRNIGCFLKPERLKFAKQNYTLEVPVLLAMLKNECHNKRAQETFSACCWWSLMNILLTSLLY